MCLSPFYCVLAAHSDSVSVLEINVSLSLLGEEILILEEHPDNYLFL